MLPESSVVLKADTLPSSQAAVNQILRGINARKLASLDPIRLGVVSPYAAGYLGATPLSVACAGRWPRGVSALLTLGASAETRWGSLTLSSVVLLSIESDSEVPAAVEVLQVLHSRSAISVKESAEIPPALVLSVRAQALAQGYGSLARALTQ